jgi:hypothetical protein
MKFSIRKCHLSMDYNMKITIISHFPTDPEVKEKYKELGPYDYDALFKDGTVDGNEFRDM